MADLPGEVRKAWDERDGAVVFGTVDSSGKPNIIYVTCVGDYGGDRLVVADNYFNKTRENILAGSKGSMLFITKGGKAYQVKGSLEYCRDGEIYVDMKKWNSSKHPGHAAVALRVAEVYSGGDKLL